MAMRSLRRSICIQVQAHFGLAFSVLNLFPSTYPRTKSHSTNMIIPIFLPSGGTSDTSTHDKKTYVIVIGVVLGLVVGLPALAITIGYVWDLLRRKKRTPSDTEATSSQRRWIPMTLVTITARTTTAPRTSPAPRVSTDPRTSTTPSTSTAPETPGLSRTPRDLTQRV